MKPEIQVARVGHIFVMLCKEPFMRMDVSVTELATNPNRVIDVLKNDIRSDLDIHLTGHPLPQDFLIALHKAKPKKENKPVMIIKKKGKKL